MTFDIEAEYRALDRLWVIDQKGYLSRSFDFKDYRSALDFVIRISAIADQLNHHPAVYLSWGKVKLDIWTHDTQSLSLLDFKFAKAIDRLYIVKLST